MDTYVPPEAIIEIREETVLIPYQYFELLQDDMSRLPDIIPHGHLNSVYMNKVSSPLGSQYGRYINGHTLYQVQGDPEVYDEHGDYITDQMNQVVTDPLAYTYTEWTPPEYRYTLVTLKPYYN